MDQIMRNLDEQALHAMFRRDECEKCNDYCMCHDYGDAPCSTCKEDDNG